MKLSKVLKVFSALAVVSTLVPYRVTKDEETGEKKVRALLWEVTQTPQEDSTEKSVSLQLGFFNPLADDDEAHMFADDLAVEYTPDDFEDTAAVEEAGAAEEAAEAEEETEEFSEDVEEVSEEADDTAAVEEESDDTEE